MDGPAALAYLKRRLKLEGVSIEDPSAETTAMLYDELTAARQMVTIEIAERCPILRYELVTLEDTGSNDTWQVPVAETRLPLRWGLVRDATTREPLTPAPTGRLDMTNGDYELLTTRSLRVAEAFTVNGLEAFVCFDFAEQTIGATTTGVQFFPQTAVHRLIVLCAAWLVLSQDEEHDVRNALALYQHHLNQIVTRYAHIDDQEGASLRGALMETMGELYGDTIY